MWWYPPPPPGPDSRATTAEGSYFRKRLFLWMPRKMWAFRFDCPKCTPKVELTSKGLYNRVRNVVDIKDQYYLATEYLECNHCKGTFISYDSRLQEQLPEHIRVRFQIVLTRKFACDISVVAMMRSRTLGNSPTALCNNVRELHTDEWMRLSLCYLTDCQRHKKKLDSLKLSPCSYNPSPPFKSPPTPKWFLAIYIRDVWARLPWLKASATSVYGTVLKIDSTKKITRKLQVRFQSIQ